MNLDGPVAYFITFHTHGTWLHGRSEQSVDRRQNAFGSPRISANAALEARRRGAMRQSEMVFTNEQREDVDRTMREVCAHRGWHIRALNVRTNHVHIVVVGGATPEKMLGDFKRWATRRLRERGLVDSERLVWSEHGSTRYLWNDGDVFEACEYVVKGQ
jgi:REP element-mobilizing transposase RayT